MFPSSFLSTRRMYAAKNQQPKLAIALLLNSCFIPAANALTNISCAPAPTSALVVNVQNTGATGNGVTDDTAAIQAAINQAAGTGGTVLIPNGTYMINAVTSLSLMSNMTLSLSAGAILKAIPNNQDNYSIILIQNASNVNVIGGTVQGDRDQHLTVTGEYGMGIEILASNTVTLQGITSKNNWGDGFYFGQNSSNITACSVTANNNRRNGATLTFVNGVVIENSMFIDSNGLANDSGIDIEPNPGQTVNNVQILNSEFQNNWYAGIQASFPSLADATTSSISNLTIQGNTINNNGIIGAYSAAINLSSQTGVNVLNNIVSNNVQDGILLVNNSTRNNIIGNTVTGSGYTNPITDFSAGYGILVQNGSNLNTITHNIVTGNESGGVVDQVGGNRINSNSIN
jgi:parallel beta-helix repeat protein